MSARVPEVGDRIALAPGTPHEYVAVICAVRETTVDVVAHGMTKTISRDDVREYLPPRKQRTHTEYDPQRLRQIGGLA